MLAIVGAFNLKFYKKIVDQSLGRSIGFLILFIVLISAVISFKHTKTVKEMLPRVISWTQEQFEDVISDLPQIQIKDGEVVLPQGAYLRKWGDNFALVIEPKRDSFYGLIEKYPNAIVLIQKSLAVKSTKKGFEESEIRTYDLKKIKSLKITPEEAGLNLSVENKSLKVTSTAIKNFFKKLAVYIYPLFCLWFVALYCFNKPLQILFFSLLSLIINNFLKTSLNYKQLLNIGIYAVVPATTLAIVKDLFAIKIILFGLLYCAIYGIYLFLGIKEAGKPA